jgi:hypothetical protein
MITGIDSDVLPCKRERRGGAGNVNGCVSLAVQRIVHRTVSAGSSSVGNATEQRSASSALSLGNYLISGLSWGTVCLRRRYIRFALTADCVLEQGSVGLDVPGSITSTQSRCTLRLIL